MVLNRLTPKYFAGLFITLVDVDVSPDLSVAKVYISFLNTDDKNKSLEKVRAHAKEIRKELSQTSVKGLRKVPDLTFYLDETMDHADRINEILKDI